MNYHKVILNKNYNKFIWKYTHKGQANINTIKNWMHLFVASLACKSVDRSTFCMKRGSAPYKKCAFGPCFYMHMKLQKDAFSFNNYILVVKYFNRTKITYAWSNNQFRSIIYYWLVQVSRAHDFHCDIKVNFLTMWA